MFDAPALIGQLAAQRVEFVVIGGIAMIAHGATYITKDLDICYHRTPPNIAALAAALAPLHPYLRGAPPGLPFRFDAATIQAGLNFTLVTDHGDLDLLGQVSGVGGYEQAWLNRTNWRYSASSCTCFPLMASSPPRRLRGAPKTRDICSN